MRSEIRGFDKGVPRLAMTVFGSAQSIRSLVRSSEVEQGSLLVERSERFVKFEDAVRHNKSDSQCEGVVLN